MRYLTIVLLLTITGCSSVKVISPMSMPPDVLTRPEPVPVSHDKKSATMKPYTVNNVTYTPKIVAPGTMQYGTASWYGAAHHGQKTSTGEIFDMYDFTAAHPTWPLPSYVRVTNLKNKRSLIVKINDRGPFSKNRIIDVSAAAAFRLGFYHDGATSVDVEYLK